MQISLLSSYSIRVEPLKYFGLISRLRYLYNNNFSGNEPSDAATPVTFPETFAKSNKVNKVVYGKLISAKSSSPVKSQLKWINSISFDEGCTADWNSAYCLAARCTKRTKLINFQYRFLHRALPTNLLLTKINNKQDPNCSFRHNHPENLIHLFWNYSKTAAFWENVTEKLKQCNFISINKLPKTASIYLGLRPDTS